MIFGQGEHLRQRLSPFHLGDARLDPQYQRKGGETQPMRTKTKPVIDYPIYPKLTKAPIFKAQIRDNPANRNFVEVRFYCEHCRIIHQHGHPKPFRVGDMAHWGAHCKVESPYEWTGYYLTPHEDPGYVATIPKGTRRIDRDEYRRKFLDPNYRGLFWGRR